MKITNDMYPSAETILAVVEHPEAKSPHADAVFRYLLDSRECRAALTFVSMCVASELDRKREQTLLHQLQMAGFKNFMFRDNLSKGESFDAIAAGMPSILLLKSLIAPDDIHFWSAAITFPDVDQPESPLAIRISAADGLPIPRGELIIFGIEIPINNGMGQLTRTQLMEFHHKGGVAFRWPDGSEISGAPVLNV